MGLTNWFKNSGSKAAENESTSMDERFNELKESLKNEIMIEVSNELFDSLKMDIMPHLESLIMDTLVTYINDWTDAKYRKKLNGTKSSLKEWVTDTSQVQEENN